MPKPATTGPWWCCPPLPPYKFPVAVLTAIGGDTSGTEFQQMDRLSEITNVPVPENLAGLLGKEEKHTGVIEKEAMLEYVLSL